MRWFEEEADHPPWIKALAEVRRLGPREGWRYQHVQAIMLSIDQYAESALGWLEIAKQWQALIAACIAIVAAMVAWHNTPNP
jgi:hypothetical protein